MSDQPVTITPVVKTETSAVAPIPVVEVAATSPVTGKEDAAAPAEPAQTEEEKKNKPRGMSKYLATVKEREAKAAEKEQALAEKEKALAEREQKTAQDTGVTTEDLKLRPTEFLKKFGITFEEFANAVINEGQPPTADDEVKKLNERLAKIEEDKAEEARKAQEAKDRESQDYINRTTEKYKTVLKEVAQAEPDKYELIIANNAFELAFEVVSAYWESNGKILDMKEALDHTENYLFERAKKLTSVKKLGFAAEPEKKSDPAPVKTLTNGLASHSVPSTGIPGNLSREDRLKMASQKLRYN